MVVECRIRMKVLRTMDIKELAETGQGGDERKRMRRGENKHTSERGKR